MYNGQIVKDLCDERKIAYKDLLKAIGAKNPSGSINVIVNGNPTAKRLEAIADYLDIPIESMFVRDRQYGYNVVGNGNNVANITIGTLKDKVQDQQSIIEEKDKRIALLEDMVELYREQLGKQNP